MGDDYNDAYEYEVTQYNGGIETRSDNNSNTFQALGSLFQYFQEKEITKREIERYRAMRDVAITKITKEFEFRREYMNKSFEERRNAIEKCFKIVDAGLENKNYDLVSKGLENMTAIVKSNPFKIFQQTTLQERHKMLEDGKL